MSGRGGFTPDHHPQQCSSGLMEHSYGPQDTTEIYISVTLRETKTSPVSATLAHTKTQVPNNPQAQLCSSLLCQSMTTMSQLQSADSSPSTSFKGEENSGNELETIVLSIMRVDDPKPVPLLAFYASLSGLSTRFPPSPEDG